MIRGGFQLAAIVMILIAYLPVSAGDRPVVAVFDVNAEFSIQTKVKLQMITELMAEELGVGGVFQIIPPGEVKKALQEHSRESYRDCYDESCQIELGKQLPADKLLTTTVRKIGSDCRVTGSLYDLKRQTTDTVAREVGGCTETDLADSIEEVAAKIRDSFSGKDPSKDEKNVKMPEAGSEGGWDQVTKQMTKPPTALPPKQPAEQKRKPSLNENQKAYRKIKGPVSDVLLSAGMSVNFRKGLDPRHESSALTSGESFLNNMGLRLDGRFFLGTFTDEPILRDIGISGSFNVLPGLEYGPQDSVDKWDTTQYQWQLAIIYRLSLTEVLLKPSFIISVGYGSTLCTIDTTSSLATSVDYSYPHFALEVLLALYEPFLSLRTSIGYSYLFSSMSYGESDVDVQESGNGLVVGVGLDFSVFEQIHIGIGYEWFHFFGITVSDPDRDMTDTFQNIYLRVGWDYQ